MVHSSFTLPTPRVAILASLALLSAGLRAQLTVTLTGSMHNGSAVPCFGMQEGTIQSAVSGGTEPYSYAWSNGKTTASISDVAAGYYELKVIDALGAIGEAQITLTEPEPLSVTATPHKYANGFNISCYECYNGSIDVEVEQGTPPYAYTWDDASVTTQDRTALGANRYTVLVTDANGCEEKADVTVTQPERSDWTMTGNAGTNPATQYIGTSDNKDVVFKANGQESLRLKANGDISLLGSLSGDGVLFRDQSGKLRLAGDDQLPTLPSQDCWTHTTQPYWNSTGNSFAQICPDYLPKLGTRTAAALKIITNDVQRMLFTADGKVGIGAATNLHALTVSSPNARTVLEVRSSATNESESCELWFAEGDTQRWAIGSDFSTNGSQDFYIWDHVAEQNRFVIDSAGRVGIGTAPPNISSSPYKLYVEGGIVTRDVLVKLGNWPDYVFDADHELLPLPEFHAFVKKYHHLPGIPSACELEADGGVALGDMQRALLKTVEEQALYILQLEERIGRMEQRLQAVETTQR